MEGSQDHELDAPGPAGAGEPGSGALVGAGIGAVLGLGPGFLASVALAVKGVWPLVLAASSGSTWFEVPHFRLAVKMGLAFVFYVIFVTVLTGLGWWLGRRFDGSREKRNPGVSAGVVDSGRTRD